MRSILFALVFLVNLYSQTFIKNYQYQWQDTNNFTQISTEWKITENIPLFHNTSDKYLWVRFQIPQHSYTKPALCIPSIYHHFTVMDHQQVIYQHGDFYSSQQFFSYGDLHKISTDITQNEYVYLCIRSSLSEIGITEDIFITETDKYYIETIKEESGRLILGSIYIFLGIFSLLLFFHRKTQTILIYLGSFSLALGAYTICWLQIKSFYPVSDLWWLYIEYISLYSLPIFFCCFFMQIFGAGPRQLIATSIKLHTCYLSFCLIYAIFDPLWWPTSLIGFHCLFLFSAGLVFFVSFRAVIQGNNNAKIFIGGLIILISFATYDVLGKLKMITWSKPIVHWGMFVFMMSIAIILERRFYYTHLQLEKINKACSRFVPWKFMELLGYENITEVALGDQIEMKTTVLFSDIRSFTSLCENMTPQENFNFINSYLQKIVPIIRKYNGFVDKYIGDAIMAIFPGEPIYALQAAREMIEKIDEYNNEAKPKYPLKIGVGIHTGTLMLGIIGESERMDCTVIADAVNTASRLEDLTKKYNAGIITTDVTLEFIEGEIPHRFLDKVTVKGKKHPVAIYEILTKVSHDRE
ncbi:adenylate/guanylate cyclase domain-containing protein [Candidatus Uabimicrobium amorphum]|uniref:Guanylate cyclase n=1 Tax=Uabimicrobium amorphum TaxID=2596890 RepID=A0A5S9II35_UABAM|nr:adenylate/guanylate cyclase domain-containing protein [Candidatus Uabimicrobium amorphum]BBM81951.1 guanylate cyclase [Candidatus Uabimicrobium amorphum]